MSKYYRLMGMKLLGASQSSERDQILDAGAHTTLEAQFRIVNAGSTGSVQLQHSATGEPGAWVDLGSAIALNATTNTHVTHSSFLRFVRWTTDAATAGSPIGLIDVIAKD